MIKNIYKIESVGISLDFNLCGGASEPENKVEFLSQMQLLEKGAIANIDENRMVGHYWLRDESLSPTEEIKKSIKWEIEKIKAFSKDILSGTISANGKKFEHALMVGIGGSALGPQLLADCFSPKVTGLKLHFLDNTDPDGISDVKKTLENHLSQTLVIIASKSGSTPETYNGEVIAQSWYHDVNLEFGDHAVAITQDGSALFKRAEKWLEKFLIWDWVGGRTSLFSAVGLLPAGLLGLDVEELLLGAKLMDIATRAENDNPALFLANTWFKLGGGKGDKAMVILPYRDRLLLLSRYMQQLIMESLGKEKNIRGDVVNQGIAVFGNKGSTDQHAYVQQLRDGRADFFANFISVLEDKDKFEIEKNITAGDYLLGFLLGTSKALYENGRNSISIIIDKLTPLSFAALIALYERAVGFYALMVGINAYHQPGVEAGKKAAGKVIELTKNIISTVSTTPQTINEICKILGCNERDAFYILSHLVANDRFIQKDSADKFSLK